MARTTKGIDPRLKSFYRSLKYVSFHVIIYIFYCYMVVFRLEMESLREERDKFRDERDKLLDEKAVLSVSF